MKSRGWALAKGGNAEAPWETVWPEPAGAPTRLQIGQNWWTAAFTISASRDTEDLWSQLWESSHPLGLLVWVMTANAFPDTLALILPSCCVSWPPVCLVSKSPKSTYRVNLSHLRLTGGSGEPGWGAYIGAGPCGLS